MLFTQSGVGCWFAAEQEKDNTVKKIALAAMLSLTLSGQARAGLVEIVSTHSPPAATGIVVLQSSTSDLAEPEVFAMMLLGLVLIGYRASRDSSEKFT